MKRKIWFLFLFLRLDEILITGVVVQRILSDEVGEDRLYRQDENRREKWHFV